MARYHQGDSVPQSDTADAGGQLWLKLGGLSLRKDYGAHRWTLPERRVGESSARAAGLTDAEKRTGDAVAAAGVENTKKRNRDVITAAGITRLYRVTE